MTGEASTPMRWPMEAQKAVERAVWEWGVQGDACALLAHRVLTALLDAGFPLEEDRSKE